MCPARTKANMPRWKNIFEAVSNNDMEAVEYFIEVKQIPTRSTNSDKQSAAHVAAENCNFEILKYLLNKDSSLLNLMDGVGYSVFFWAIEKGSLEIVKYLVDVKGVDIAQQNKNLVGNTAIHMAAEVGQLPILKYFIEEKQGDINVRNEIGEPPVFVAVEKTQLNVVKYLAERGANMTTIDCNKDNVLYLCAKTGDLHVAKYLLDEKKIELDINYRNSFGYTVTFLAARFNNLDIVKYFVEEKHADVNIADNEGKTPLHEVANIGYTVMVRYLVEHGADLELKDKCCNKTPVETTMDKDIFQYLQKVMSRKRNRRSVELVFFPQGVCSKPTAHKSVERTVDGESNLRSYEISVPQVENFLMLANVCVRFFKSSPYERKKHQSLLSPMEILRNLMDPVAVESINHFLNTKNSKRYSY